MSSLTKVDYLNAAVEIGEKILNKHIRTDDLSWETLALSGNKIVYQKSENLYSGNSGIAFFFLELYKSTKDDRYLLPLLQSAKGIEKHCIRNNTDNYSFYTGRMGVIFLFLKLFELTSDDKYLNLSIQLVKTLFKSSITNPVDDLINGKAGTLLGLIHLHSFTKDEQTLSYIEKYTNHLLNKFHFYKSGIYWDRSQRSINGLCGFSHGVSGLAYLFLELGNYFNNPALYQISELAFSYENEYYISTWNNWSDLRNGYHSTETLQQHKKAYQNGEISFFEQAKDTTAWCHGAPGIGLARIRAYELTNNMAYLDDLKNAVKKTYDATVTSFNDNVSFTLCHGKGGNAFLFKDAEKVINNSQKYSEWIDNIANKAILSYRRDLCYKNGFHLDNDLEDISLFMGESGIGYFYLMASSPGKIKSTILRPDVIGGCNDRLGVLDMDKHSIFELLLKKKYPRVSSLSNFSVTKVNDLVRITIEKIDNEAFKQITLNGTDAVKSEFQIDVSRNRLNEISPGHSYLGIRQIVEIEKNYALLNNFEDKGLEFKLVLFDKTCFVFNDYTQEKINESSDKLIYLLIPNASDIYEFPLSKFTYLVLQSFTTPTSTQQAIIEIINNKIMIDDDSELQIFRSAIVKQVKEALSIGVLQLA